MALVYRLVKGTPLTAAEYDANLSELDTKASPATIRAEVESELVAGSNITITPGSSGATRTLTIASTAAGNTFSTVAVSGQSNVVADTTSDTLTLVAGSNITITTDAGADSVTIAATGGGTDQPLFFDAAEFIPRTTNGCGISSEETATNRINRDLLAFDAGAIEYAQKGFVWPEGWATATCTFFWKASSGTGSCVWAARMRVFSDGDSEDNPMGTAQAVTDTPTANSHRQTSATAAITPSGSVDGGRHSILEVYRDATNGSDDLSVDALLIGVALTKAS